MIAKKINGFIGITRLDKPIGIYLLLWPALIALLISTEASINYSFVIIIVAWINFSEINWMRDQ